MSHAPITVLPCIAVALAETGNVWTIVVAGGCGARFGRLKQYETIGEQRIVDHSVATAIAAGTNVVLVVPAHDVTAEVAQAGSPADDRAATIVVVAGGETRAASVRCGLAAVPASAAIVCVHDAARPFASVELYRAVVAAVRAGADAVVPGVAVTDTIKLIDAHRVVTATPPRDALVAVQTPQAFCASVLRDAHRHLDEATDDAALVESNGGRVIVVPGEIGNRKITHPGDLEWARREWAVRTDAVRDAMRDAGRDDAAALAERPQR